MALPSGMYMSDALLSAFISNSDNLSYEMIRQSFPQSGTYYNINTDKPVNFVIIQVASGTVNIGSYDSYRSVSVNRYSPACFIIRSSTDVTKDIPIITSSSTASERIIGTPEVTLSSSGGLKYYGGQTNYGAWCTNMEVDFICFY